jgi:pSer/pThr/pTyr-binding forkhead associated (FHA) protein
MVAARVILTVTAGSHRGQQFAFRGPTSCVVGRSSDCSLRLAGGLEDWLVSRRHCQLDVDEPGVRVLDLGSLNGTFINGRRLPGSSPRMLCENDTEVVPRAFELKDGDELMVGPVPFRLSIETEKTA